MTTNYVLTANAIYEADDLESAMLKLGTYLIMLSSSEATTQPDPLFLKGTLTLKPLILDKLKK